MHVLFPTGRQSAPSLRLALSTVTEFDYEIVETGEIASFLTPAALMKLIESHPCDLVVVSGMCTASFHTIEERANVPVRKGTRHAADMRICVPLILAGSLPIDMPADDLLAEEKKKAAREGLILSEYGADAFFTIRGVKIGGTSRIKVIHEIMDAHRHPALRDAVINAQKNGADIVDLGFGFDATPDDVVRCFSFVADLDIPLSIDTLDPQLIEASLFRADLILSLTKETIPLLAEKIQSSGAAVVLIPRDGSSLDETISSAVSAGMFRILADPLLQPPLSGMTRSLAAYLPETICPKILGCVNVVEMMDADSPGICAMLASVAAETGCACVLISEHSDKTQGATAEMRRAVEMMALSTGRPYPKDVGLDLLILKEKRLRREPPLLYADILDAPEPSDSLTYDPKGNFRIGIENGYIVAVRSGKAIRGTSWYQVFSMILSEEGVSLLDHAAYLGKELYKAELSIRFGRSFEQDGPF
ncbi:MAG TPA: dihydropteroate synthase [Methanocorpusculum sp.]|nr:dihydropteroate synthase [Methanocorpusculum sp.]